jgi:hypothetical protein
MKPHTVRHAPNGHVEAVYTLADGTELQVQGDTPKAIKAHLKGYLDRRATASEPAFPDDVDLLPSPEDLEL